MRTVWGTLSFATGSAAPHRHEPLLIVSCLLANLASTPIGPTL